MLKQTITYTDFDDLERTETLYFNLTRTDLVDLLDLEPELLRWQERLNQKQQTEGTLTVPEIRELLEIIKRLVRHSYGVRSEDGRKHRKSDEIFEDFKASAVYDAFMMSMFMDVQKGIDFMIGILPSGMVEVEEVAKAIDENRAATVTEVPIPDNVTDISATVVEVPAWMREDRDPTAAELKDASPEELREAFRRKSQKQ
jgi:hypothetical protein